MKESRRVSLKLAILPPLQNCNVGGRERREERRGMEGNREGRGKWGRGGEARKERRIVG